MPDRLVRLALAAGVAASLALPLAPPATAGACNDRQFPEVCAALDAACQSSEAVRKVCRLFE